MLTKDALSLNQFIFNVFQLEDKGALKWMDFEKKQILPPFKRKNNRNLEKHTTSKA